ncbi:uncharacterized protein LOC120659239 [Panicum virgatum]|uniref:uncharacterized protein LOC120659239 n=1 Tax=Panicum virgatum TaxID=38727 RepID=UPI0019D59D30|nr:uncharacterized protein LOC120659239 [Panicum virgatum]
MSILLAAVLGDLTTRSINFLIKSSFQATTPDVEDRLRRILFRAQVIVDEAMGRQITNRGVLQQLDMLRDAMHHSYYILDTFRYQSHSEEEAKGLFVNGASMVTLLRWSNLSTPCSMSSRASWLMKTVHPTNLLPRKLYGVSCTELLVSYDYSCIVTWCSKVQPHQSKGVCCKNTR